jgi:hypothetical protein
MAEAEGVVAAQLPSGLYDVDVDGRRVMVELSPRDQTRGRIVRKA